MEVFSTFYEEEQEEMEFQSLTKRLVDEAKRKTGTPPPIVFFTECTPEEQKIVRHHFERLTDLPIGGCDNSKNLPIQSCLPRQHIPVASFIHDLKRLSGKEKKITQPNAYELMHIFLASTPLKRYKKTFYIFNGIYYQSISEDDLRIQIFTVLEPAIAAGKGTQILRQVLELLQSYYAIQVHSTTETPTRLFVANGCLDVESGQLLPVSAFDFFTSCIVVDYPTNFIPTCPIFDQFLRTISNGDAVLVEAFWEAIGYLLTTDMAGKAFILFWGVGDSGKSVMGNLISSFFNPEAVSFLDIFRFRDRFSTSQLKGKRLNICMDLPHGRISREAVGVIKLITGDDKITVEEKFRDAESFKPTCKLLFGSNYPLQLSEPDLAFERRLVVLPFCVSVPKDQQDKELLNKLFNERSGILWKSMRAQSELKARNYQFLKVSERNPCCGYAQQGEALQNFLTSCCMFGEEFRETTAALHEAFNHFCSGLDLVGIPDRIQFSRQLKRICGDRINSKKIREGAQTQNAYIGIRLKMEGEVGHGI